jgi:glycosyltransferase involved in cell wall biosynthesis
VLTPEHLAVIRNAPILALLRLLGVKVVFRLAMAPERGRVQQRLWQYVLPPFVTQFVPNSRFSYARLIERGVPESKITLIRNALARRYVSPESDADVVQLAASRPTILAVGQILPFKGTHLFVDAVLQLRREGFDVQGIVLGSLPTWPSDLVEYAARLRQRAADEGATDRLHFAGVRENIPEIMKASFLLATPILGDEAFGNVALEARSVGLPVVTFARGGLTELVEHGRTGYVCETSDLEGLVQGLRHYLADPAARAAASANSLAVSSAPDNDCSAQEFERRWWDIFKPTAAPVAVTIEKDLVTQ